MERKEPTLSSAPIDHHDDILSTPPKSTARPGAAAQARAPEPLAAKHRPAPIYTPKASGSWVAGLALLVAIAATAGSGYLAWKLEQSERELRNADSRIEALEERLTFTGEESTQSVEALRAKMKWADSEIRKLWGVSYDTNRKSIQANEDLLKKMESQVASAVKVGKAAQQLGDTHKNLLAALQKASSADSSRLANALTSVEQQRKSLQDAVDKANQANTDLTRLRNDLKPRVKRNEEAIAAIDASRMRTNREIIELKQRAGLQ